MAEDFVVVKDSKYSWLVMASVLYSMFLCGMLTFGSVSVLVYVWSEMFKLNANLAAWAPAIMGASYQMTGPFLTMLMQVIGHWKFHLIGAALTLCATIATAFASQYWHVIVSFAIVQGLGLAMIEFASTDVIATYSEKHKDKIYAAQTLAFSIGITATPPLLEHLIKITSYRTALIILSIPNLMSFPIAFVYRGQWCAHCQVYSNAEHDSNEDCSNAAYTGEESYAPEKLRNQTNCSYTSDKWESDEEAQHSINRPNEVEPGHENSRRKEQKSSNKNVEQTTQESSKRTTVSPVLTERDVSEKKENATSMAGGHTASANIAQTVLAPDCEQCPNNSNEATRSVTLDSQRLSVLASHAYVLKEPAFILFLFYNFFAAAGEFTFYAFAVDFSVSMGILTLTDAALGVTLTGISFFVAAVLLTILSHWDLNRLMINILSVLIMGLAILGVSLSQSLEALYSCFIIFGFAEGLYVSNQVCYVGSYFIPSDYMIIRLSYVFVVTGIGALLGPVVAGQFSEIFGMKYLYIFTGGLSLTGFFILFVYWLGKKVSEYR